MGVGELAIVLVAGVLAGMVNTIVGAGTLITFPLLVTLGVPPLIANMSNTVGLVPASAAGAWGYRRELSGHWAVVWRMAIVSAIGGILGALLLLVAPEEAFVAVVPWLLVLAAALAVLQPRLAAALRRRADARAAAAAATTVDTTTVDAAPGAAEPVTVTVAAPVNRPLTPGLALAVGATGIYGGYFGAAQGVVLLAVLGIAWSTDLQRANGAKNVLAGVANLVSATVFVLSGLVDWRLALLIALGSTLGGLLGARVGRRIPAPLLRGLIVVAALTAAGVLLLG